MNVRRDFESVNTYLHRLDGIGSQFARYNTKDWPYLKNQEDFNNVYELPDGQRCAIENLYATGRDCAIFMSSKLREFNDVGMFPSLADYVDSFDRTWMNEQDELQDFIKGIKENTALQCIPWSVQRMIEVFEDQLRLLASVRMTVNLLKQTNLYKIEKGEAPVEKEHAINIGQIHGKVNINSTDNSTIISIDSSSIYTGISEAITKSTIEEDLKVQLLRQIDEMKYSEGTQSFLQKYKDFMQNAANHMTVISPFIPALSSLIS
jgi:hypothetical protein